jgi:antitoxin YefM
VRCRANPHAPVIDIGQSSVHLSGMHAVSYSEARENLKAMIDKVVADRAPIAITRQRGEGAVLISESEWSSIEETLYLLRSPRNAERLLEAVRGFEAGEEQGIGLK